ncbi:hypothetical protein [Microbispora rosea]|uniref:hypothetical protein n=1 Tax=Microbispora rosea TaxID=58117 RepID=UPI0037A88080
MTRLTVAALHRMAKAAQTHDHPTVTIVTHPQQGGGRYACWSTGCILLPAPLLEELGQPADGSYRITTRGLGDPAEILRFTPAFAKVRMLPLLDTTPRRPLTPSCWLFDRPPLRARLLDPPGGPPTAAVEEQWDAWTKPLNEVPVWQGGDWYLLWAPDPTTRAVGLLTTVHHRFVPEPPQESPL